MTLNINVNLTPRLEEMVRRKMHGGLYHSASEVIREALRLMDERDKIRAVKLEQLKQDSRDVTNDDVSAPSDTSQIHSQSSEKVAS